MQKCRTIELSNYRAVGLSIRTGRFRVLADPGHPSIERGSVANPSENSEVLTNLKQDLKG